LCPVFLPEYSKTFFHNVHEIGFDGYTKPPGDMGYTTRYDLEMGGQLTGNEGCTPNSMSTSDLSMGPHLEIGSLQME
jgi:hypothetical protein